MGEDSPLTIHDAQAGDNVDVDFANQLPLGRVLRAFDVEVVIVLVGVRVVPVVRMIEGRCRRGVRFLVEETHLRDVGDCCLGSVAG